MAPCVDIFIRSYFRDFRWLTLSLRSIAKFVEGYRQIVIVMPGSSFERLRGDEIPPSIGATVFPCPEFDDDYLGQQVSKLNADRYTDADLIAHIDSDCIFQQRCMLPALVTKGGRPIVRMLWQSRRSSGHGWRRCIADFHGTPLPFDALVPPPIAYPRKLYEDLRTQCRTRHGITIEAWCLSRSPHTVSEFGLLTAQAWLHHRHDYCWGRADAEVGWPCKQYWSRSPNAPGECELIERALALG